MGDCQRPPSKRAVQIETSGRPSSLPPNHAASSPSRVSTIVEAWADANGARSNTGSDDTIASRSEGLPHAAPRPRRIASPASG